MNKFWDNRYSNKNYVYGKEPNRFFKEQIDKTEPGKILLPGDGEGRNAVYAASKSWNVDAFDASQVALKKAMKLAQLKQVKINYWVQSADKYKSKGIKYDMIALIFVHFIPEIRAAFHRKLSEILSSGGLIILEAFSSNQIHYQSGGPKDPGLLYTLNDLENDFSGLQILMAEQNITWLNEGEFHQGEAEVIRVIAQKN